MTQTPEPPDYDALAREAEMGYDMADGGASIGKRLSATTDAAEWAKAFIGQFGDRHQTWRACPDEATMLTWFANAIETGRSQGRKELCPHHLLRLADDLWICRDCGAQVDDGGEYRIALRPYTSEGGKGEHPSEWGDGGTEPVSPPLDDIVVRDVPLFRMEDMGDHFWMCCYLDDGPDYDRISFNVRKGRPKKGEPGIVVEAYEFPEADVTYETD